MVVTLGASPLFGPSGPKVVAKAQPSLSLASKGIDPVGLNAQSAFQVATQQATRGGAPVAKLLPPPTPTAHPAMVATLAVPSAPAPTVLPTSADVGTSAAAAAAAPAVAAAAAAPSSGNGGGGGGAAPGPAPVSAASPTAAGGQPSASVQHGIPYLVPVLIGVAVLGVAAFVFLRKKKKNPPRYARRRSGVGRNIKRLRKKGYKKGQATAIALREAGIAKR